MVGIELAKDRAAKELAPRETSEVLRRCIKKGVIPPSATCTVTICMLASPVITEEQLAQVLDVTEEATAEVEEEAKTIVPGPA